LLLFDVLAQGEELQKMTEWKPEKLNFQTVIIDY